MRSSILFRFLPHIAIATILLNSYFAWIQYRNIKQPKEPEFSVDSQPIETTQTAVNNNGYINFPSSTLEGAEDLVLVFKTGATELYKSLPVHLSTTLSHAPNHLFFSDHEQRIAQYKIQNALDQVSPDTIEGNKDFELYEVQNEFMALGQSPEYLGLKGGWDLDKYKNIHMMKKTWEQRPNAKWYLFVDADTYVMMAGMLYYLRSLDHTKPLYLGDAYEINNLKFGQGGTGYVISHGAMKAVMESEPNMPRNHEAMAKDNCCGDYVLGEVMKEHGITLSETYPNFCGEGPGRIGFLPKNHCQPVVTLHHMLPSEISDMWTFERHVAGPGRYVLMQNIFEHFVWPYVVSNRTAWDGMSPIHGWPVDIPTTIFDGDKKKGLSKQEKMDILWAFCERTCKEKGEDECMQFQIEGEAKCRHYDGMAMGYAIPSTREDRDDFRSGWLVDRIEKTIRNIQCTQPDANWPKSVIRGA